MNRHTSMLSEHDVRETLARAEANAHHSALGNSVIEVARLEAELVEAASQKPSMICALHRRSTRD